MNKLRNQTGTSLAEVLIVVAIMSALTGVGFVSVNAYMRDMTKLQYDGYAKEIFFAAQNHLTMAETQGYLGRSNFGINELGEDNKETSVNYYVVENGTGLDDINSVLGLMLPIASIDETVRAGSYIIRYDKSTAQVLDVFYWSESGRYSHQYNDDYTKFQEAAKNSGALKSYDEGASKTASVIGYYGSNSSSGESLALELKHGDTLYAPIITVKNGDTLTVEVYDPNYNTLNAHAYVVKLIVKGITSSILEPEKGTETFILRGNSTNLVSNGISPAQNGVYSVILDDITKEKDHFSKKFSGMIPGEDLSIQAVALYTDCLGNIAYSAEAKANSLFADGTETVNEKAIISSIRHLENLDPSISAVNSGAVKFFFV